MSETICCRNNNTNIVLIRFLKHIKLLPIWLSQSSKIKRERISWYACKYTYSAFPHPETWSSPKSNLLQCPLQCMPRSLNDFLLWPYTRMIAQGLWHYTVYTTVIIPNLSKAWMYWNLCTLKKHFSIFLKWHKRKQSLYAFNWIKLLLLQMLSHTHLKKKVLKISVLQAWCITHQCYHQGHSFSTMP